MATFLSKLGRFSFRKHWLVAAAWIAVLILVGVLARSAAPAPPNDFSMPGTESQRAYDVLNEHFPGTDADAASARIVFKAEHGKVTDPAVHRQIEQAVGELRHDPQVAQVADPFTAKAVSKDRTTAYAQVSYKVSSTELADASRTALLDTVEHARSDTLAVEAGGKAVNDVPGGGGHSSEAVGLGVAAVVLVLTSGSLVAAGLPLLTALLGVVIAAGSVTALSAPLGLGSTTTALATMIGLAVGIDYALFVVSRYRGELARGRSREEAAGLAVGTAGSAVVFAGLTVVIALVGLAVVGIPMLTQMGLAAAGTVALAVLVALTLIPALLGIAGRAVGPAKQRKRRNGMPRTGLGVRWARFVTRRPIAVLTASVAVLAALAIPVASLQMGLPGDGSKPASTTQRRAYDLISDGFGPGFNGPLTMVVRAGGGGDVHGAAKEVAHRVGGMPDVAAVTPPRLNGPGDTAVLNVVPKTAPDSEQTTDLLHDLRDPTMAKDADASVLVTGTTAMNADVSQKLSDALLPYLALVVGLAFLLLIAVFRSLLVPLKAALGFLLSVLAGLGAVVAVFQWGWLGGLFGISDPGPVMSMMPIFLVGVVFGLAMDYEVFLVTRMREAYVHGLPPKDAVVSGFEHSARVVTAAALIMISVFAAFMGSDEQMIKTIGFGLAAAVLFDAFLVRMTLVPAVLALLGRRAWRLPRWLDRIVPDLDVEGEKLQRGNAADETPSPIPQPDEAAMAGGAANSGPQDGATV